MLQADGGECTPPPALTPPTQSVSDPPYMAQPPARREGSEQIIAGDPDTVSAMVRGKKPGSGPEQQNGSQSPVRWRGTGAPRRRRDTTQLPKRRIRLRTRPPLPRSEREAPCNRLSFTSSGSIVCR
jgi:hypothetical protein